MGFGAYWRDTWNKLDFVVVCVSLPILLRPFAPELVAPLEGLALLRMLRFMRMWRLLRYVQTLKTLAPLKWPTYVTLTIILLVIAVESIDLPESMRATLINAGRFAEVLALTWLVIGLYGIVHTEKIAPLLRARKPAPDDSLLDLMASVIRVLLGVLGLSMALQAAGQNPLALVAGLGIGGMAVAFAAQDAVSNVIAGVLILMQRPFKVGEVIRIGDISGTVTGIGLRATQITKFDEEIVSIPNKTFMDSAVVNVDRRKSYVHEDVLRLHRSTKIDKIDQTIRIINRLCDENEEIRGRCGVVFSDLGDYYYEIGYWFQVDRFTEDESDQFKNGWDKMRKVRSAFGLALLRELEAANIHLAMSNELINVDAGSLLDAKARMDQESAIRMSA
jgi:small-conductance mechanosensitive channel